MTARTIELYSEVHGVTRPGTTPLLVIHGGGSTIGTNFGALLPLLAATRQVLAVELQGHGHTAPTDRPVSFDNSAADVAALLDRLSSAPVDVLGFSNGGQVGLLLAARRPDLVRRLIAASAPTRRAGMVDGFWEGLAGADIASMPEVYLAADRAINPDPAHQQELFDLDRSLMLDGFTDWPDSDLTAISAPTLLVVGDRDVVRVDHVVATASRIPDARLLVVPGNHGDYLGEVFAAAGDLTAMHAALPWLTGFLDAA